MALTEQVNENASKNEFAIDPLDGLYVSVPDDLVQAIPAELQSFDLTLHSLRCLHAWARTLTRESPVVSNKLVDEEYIALDILQYMHSRLWINSLVSEQYLTKQLGKLKLQQIAQPKPEKTSPLIVTNGQELRIKAMLLDVAIHDAKNHIEGLYQDSKNWEREAHLISPHRIATLLGRFVDQIEQVPIILKTEQQDNS